MASKEFPVAIIGIATRLPGANSCNELWELLLKGKDTVSLFPSKRSSDINHAASAFADDLADDEHPYFTGSYFESVDGFDPAFFSISQKEALFIEPEQRIFLETVWELLEDAGYASKIKGTSTGVYVGNTVNKYKYILTENHPSISHGNHSPFISSRVSYTFDLHGPAMMVATGCSSSLLAVHLACQGLLSKDCEMAIAGGITLDLLPLNLKTDIWNQLGITGPNVKCRAFDAQAEGIAKGEGCGIVLLKPLQKAISDNDYIYGVLDATTANQDGRSNGITAPHPISQANMLCQAWKLAGVSPECIGYFEAHGTGTVLGDPIEVSGITKAFDTFKIKMTHKIPMSSIKANIGHLADGAAGVVALIKAVLCLKNKKIPPAIHYVEPNPHIKWGEAPVYVNTSTLDWNKSPKYASVSAFGLLGTNVHVVLKELTCDHNLQLDKTLLPVTKSYINESQILIIAANSQRSLFKFALHLAEYFTSSVDKSYRNLKNLCYTINSGRMHDKLHYRIVIYANDWNKMQQILNFLSDKMSSIDLLATAFFESWGTTEGCIMFHSPSSFYVSPSAIKTDLYAILSLYMKGKSMPWSDYYHTQGGFERIPLLPTYKFDDVRIWPEAGNPLNANLLQLQLQHKVKHLDKRQKQDALTVKAVDSEVSLSLLAETMNEVLGVNYDWSVKGDESLFKYGMDSLIFSQVCMKFNSNVPLTEFHKDPTFNSLFQSLAKMQVESTAVRVPQQSKILAVDSVLSKAFDEVLGKEYAWNKLHDKSLFELGIDSLMCTQVSMALHDALGVTLTMGELHDYPTFSGVCSVVNAKVQNAYKYPPSKDCDQTEIGKSVYPLSPVQRRLWVTQQIAINQCTYNCSNCIKIVGTFHATAFVLAVTTVLSRHSAFYTVFDDNYSNPVQKYDWGIKHKVEEISLLESGNKAMGLVHDLHKKDYETPFVLSRAPMYRCKLFQLPNDVYCFTMVVHHIIFDGWSHFVFYNEVWGTYMKLCKGEMVKNDLHKPIYADLVDANEAYSERTNQNIAYWKEKLVSPLPITTLPGDKRRPSVFTYKGKRVTRFTPIATIESLQLISKNRYTTFTNLLSLVYILIHSYTGETDLMVGSPIAGRSSKKELHAIGCFVNMLVFRVHLNEWFTFNDVLETVSKVCTDAFDHRMVPFDHLVNELDLPRVTDTTPLFSINVCYHNTELASDHVNPPEEIETERILLHNDSAKWDLYFDFLQEGDQMRFTLEYYSDAFSDAYGKDIATHFVNLLESIADNPYVPISKLLLSEQTNSFTCGHSRDLKSPLSVLLLNSLQTFSDNSFIVSSQEEKITYKELLTKAKMFSVFLRKSCGLPEQAKIGLLVENSAASLAVIVACMITGLVYIPLDYNSPKSRLEYLCKDADMRALCFTKAHIRVANYLRWTCSQLTTIFCIDFDSFQELQENAVEATLMDPELWNCVASRAKNDVEGGGWKSSYTGENITQEEMNEYAQNCFEKLKDYLTSDCRILEIGCASGLTTQKLSAFVKEYTAIDLSESMIESLAKKLLNLGRKNVNLMHACADQIGEIFSESKFDVIIMNSVVHCFPGHNYLCKVVVDCVHLLSTGGILFIGDIMDLDMKKKLIGSLKSFKKAYPNHQVKTEWENELFLSREFISFLCDSIPEFQSVSCTRKIYSIPNELTEYRFDALFTKGTKNSSSKYSMCQTNKAYALKDATEAAQNWDTYKLISTWAYQVDLKDPAYILYTSGTTGIPKGVIIGHESLLNYTLWSTEAYKFNTKTVIPLFSPLTFDFTLTSIFPPLLKGSTIHIFKPFPDSYLCMGLCSELTTIKFSPLQLDTILSEITIPISASTFIVGGEELTSTLLNKLKQNKCKEPFVIWNEYGPTEATVGCIVKCFHSEELPISSNQLVPIGMPIDNVVVTVAVGSNTLQPVPIGGVGNLYIGGKCLCLDFVDACMATSNETKHSKNFVAANWGRPGEEMLRTDDIVELMPCGDLAYFGRQKDCNTAKVNGIRIDVLEVQKAIINHPLIHNAWVCSFICKERTYLGAAVKYVVGSSPDDNLKLTTPKELLYAFLTRLLPQHSIPTVFVTISDPPTTKNGKTNTMLLQQLFINQLLVCGNHHNEVYSSDILKIQEIWKSVLPINYLPHPNDDFFMSLSGDSLQAIHVVRKMRQEGYSVCATDIYQYPSINKLLHVIDESSNKHYNSLERIPPKNKFKPTPIIEEFITSSHKPNQFALSALLHFEDNELNVDCLKEALKCVMEKHASLCSKFEVINNTVYQETLQINEDEPKVFSTTINKTSGLLVKEPEFSNLCNELEKRHSLSCGILVNASIIRYKSEAEVETFALLVVHHAVIDVVSWQQVLDDLASALKQISLNAEVSLKGPLLPFSVYCDTLHKQTEAGYFDAQIDYWNKVKEQCKTCGILISSKSIGSFESALWLTGSLEASCLRAASNRFECSDESILLTALGRALSIYHGNRKTAICLESHGRQMSIMDSTDTVGWCTSKFPVILDTPIDEDVGIQVHSIRKCLEKIPTNGLGFGFLKSANKLNLPYPKIMFVFLGSLDASAKESFHGGKHRFHHIPWIEVMMTELNAGKFHHHKDETLEDLEVIAWIHGGKLKFGFLFDKTILNQDIAKSVLKQMELNLKALVSKKSDRRSVDVDIISNFQITPTSIDAMNKALAHWQIFTKAVNVIPADQALQALHKGNEMNSSLIVLMPKVTKMEHSVKFFEECKSYKLHNKNKAVVIIAVYDKPLDCNTYFIKSINGTLQLPSYITSQFHDEVSNICYNMPFTADGYVHVGLTIARAIRGTLLKPKYKVVVVDADYTLWDGECASGKVNFNQANLALHDYLLELKQQGMLLAIVSKNNKNDVERIFHEQQNEMKLSTNDFVSITANWNQKCTNVRNISEELNLGLDAFVFIDDNPIECEQMIISSHEVLTIQFPPKELVFSFLNILWFLDNFEVTAESASRTEMYKSEMIRQKEIAMLDSYNDKALIHLLCSWNMTITIFKTNVQSLQSNNDIYARATELLYRTNQFKLNDVNLTLKAEDECWLILLEDMYGCYGIVSIVTFSNEVVSQWVLSCRALGRHVENRIFQEILKKSSIIAIKNTNRNTPAIMFFKSLGIKEIDLLNENLEIINVGEISLSCNEYLHQVTLIDDLDTFKEKCVFMQLNQHYPAGSHRVTTTQPGTSLYKVFVWIQENWSLLQKQQSAHHDMFPLIPSCKSLLRNYNTSTNCELNDRPECLKTAWMEVLQITKDPKDDDNFLFEGGTSFEAVYLASKLQRMCNINVSIMDVLQASSYASLREVVINAKPIITIAGERINAKALSAAQKRMLLMQEACPISTAYVETLAYTTNTYITNKIFEYVVNSHPMLTSKIEKDPTSNNYLLAVNQQVINLDIKYETIEDVKEASLYIRNSIPVIKTLASPLAIFRMLKAPNASVAVVHVHHIISDDVTLSNIACTIQNCLKGINSVPIMYTPENDDSCYDSSQFTLDSQFWEDKFTHLPSDVNLAILPKVDSVWNDSVPYEAKQSDKCVPETDLKLISDCCQELKITKFQYYLACAVLVLQRYLGTTNIAVAVPVNTRTDVNQAVDGLFVNTVLFTTRIACGVSLQEHILSLANNWLLTLSHSRYPLDKVAQFIWKKHNKSLSSFCCVMFNYISHDMVSENKVPVYSRHAKMPFSIDILCNSDNAVSVTCEWATEIIDGGVAKRIMSGILEMFNKAPRMLDQVIGNIPVLSNDEVHLIQSFSHTVSLPEKDNLSVIHQFQANVTKHPSVHAVICNDITLTYEQLNAQATHIASCLSQSVGHDALKTKPVLLLSEKSVHVIASILGIWKAGGHFLPVSKDTIKTVVENISVSAVIINNVSTDIRNILPKQLSIFQINDLLREPSTVHMNEETITDDYLAYIIRTSGTTGTPKQCKVSHRNLKSIANAWKSKYKMNTFNVNVLQWAPLSFDVFVGDLIKALFCSNGTLTMCPDKFRLDIPYIISLIKKHEVTMSEVTPQFGLQLLQNAKHGDLSSLKLFILGSDVLHSHVYAKVKEQLNNNQRVLNSYGMTEATIDSSFFEGSVLPKTRSNTVPIGMPLPGVCLHVLDKETLQPCPIGTVGELYIGGSVLASGDVKKVHIKGISHECLKTGDAACWLPSGDIELLGRLDNVVKLRGFRISTSEIENKIITLVKGIQDVCVTIVENDKSAKFLCAFVIPEPNVTVDYQITRSVLSGNIPQYMIPDIVHQIERVPMTENGKVNYKALPKLADIRSTSFVCEMGLEGQTQTHISLVQLFAEAMEIQPEQVNLERTYMEQGGHSLILLRFASLIKDKSPYDVEIANIFSYPSINSLATYINEAKKPNINATYNKMFNESLVDPIAITGLGMKLPGEIVSLSQLWKVLDEGKDLITSFPEKRIHDILNCIPSSSRRELTETGVYDGAFLEDINQFDSQFFKIAPGEAKYMSPEQRLFLQVASEALAEGKCLSNIRGSRIGTFVSHCETTYSKLNHPDEAICVPGTMSGMIATRVAYQWDLKGPTMLVDTACSSSLMAIKQACEAIKNNECDSALVGGVNLVTYPSRSGVFGKTSILSPDFHCKAFDEDASGTAVGEGVLCIHIEPLSTALKQDKYIYGVIKSVAANSVGRGNGITAPSSVSQQSVIQTALSSANIITSDVSFVECHGTGTVLGDRIELSALKSIFEGVDLPIGSAKTIFGHLDSNAGLLGLFKILASFTFEKIPPTAHFKSPNSEIVNSSLYVPNKTIEWNSTTKIAGLSSFGLTGTNCHAILAEHPICINENEVSGDTYAYSCPLLFSCGMLAHIKVQASLYYTYIEQIVCKNNPRCSMLDFCITVAKRLGDIKLARAEQHEYRLISLAKYPKQMMDVLKVIINATDVDVLIKLSSIRDDIHFYSAKHDVNCYKFKDFLLYGNIDITNLFTDIQNYRCRPAPGVSIKMYNEQRYWLDPSNERCLQSDHEPINTLLNRKLEDTRELVRTLTLAPTEDLRKTQARFCCAIIIRLLLKTKISDFVHQDKEVTFDQAFQLTGILEKYKKLFFVMIRELSRNDLIEPSGCNKSMEYFDCFQFKCGGFVDLDPETIANHAVDLFPSWADCFRFPLYVSKSLYSVLQGEKSPLSVIYPHGDLNFMYQFDKLGDLMGEVYYNMYLQAIAMHAIRLTQTSKKVRVLEVGAGVGHVTRQLLPKFKTIDNIEYWFTDLGKAFVENAKTLFADYSHIMKFSTFDITKSAVKQGLLGSFDIVISYNVIHTTEGVLDSVLSLKSCLGEDGTLFIIESAMNETWATLAWGILDGWWYFKDFSLRPVEPMLEPQKWEAVLSNAGFASVYSYPVNQTERNHVEKFLFICSAKKLAESSNHHEGWWETDAHRFDPVKRFDELEELIPRNSVSESEVQLNSMVIHKELESIWCDLLGIENIQPDDDFNSLGGESLLAIQMMNLVRKRIGYQLEVADTFAYPTLHMLANFIAESMDLSPKSDSINLINDNCHQIKVSPSLLSTNANGLLLMFPGQGSQKVGMCMSLQSSQEAKGIFERAEHILGYNILDICCNETSKHILNEKLKSTEFVQVALFAGCIAKLEQLKIENPAIIKSTTHVAGLSVGEFVALVHSGVLTFEDALRLIHQRGKLMENAVKQNSTGMVSVYGPSLPQLQAFLNTNCPGMKVSTYLADNQHTVAGTEEECNQIVTALSNSQSSEIDIIDVRKLKVAGAFHSIHMKQASESIDQLIKTTKFSKPLIPIIMNVDGRVVENPDEIRNHLCRQLISPVQWKQSIITAYNSGVRYFVEIAPSRVLSSIVKKRISACTDCNVEYIPV